GELEPAADRLREIARIAEEGLRGDIRVHVRLAEERRGLLGEGPAAVDEDEVGLPQRRVVEGGFEQHGITAGDSIIAADAGAGVDVDGETEATGLARDVA